MGRRVHVGLRTCTIMQVGSYTYMYSYMYVVLASRETLTVRPKNATLAQPFPRMKTTPALFVVVASVVCGVLSATEGPCDITGKAGNPCVAAHSTTRALYAAYAGPLYRVTRNSDGQSANISVLDTGGFADISVHEQFCAKMDCVISTVFDQSPQGNHLGQRHKLVNASQHKIMVGPQGTHVYGMWFDPGYGYHVDNTTGIAKGNQAESIYAVMSGTHYNGRCCFDVSNLELQLARPNRVLLTCVRSASLARVNLVYALSHFMSLNVLPPRHLVARALTCHHLVTVW